ncbi:hypothetical protein BDZ45DRAFT_698199 [Acephala macrosclerotiorum]|nr:hypothetical protein BDZ45DRAFT_698199 [Acephala macrosclerotiorum]
MDPRRQDPPESTQPPQPPHLASEVAHQPLLQLPPAPPPQIAIKFVLTANLSPTPIKEFALLSTSNVPCRSTGDRNEAVCAVQFAACRGGSSTISSAPATSPAATHPAQSTAKTTLATSSATTPVQQTATGTSPSTPGFTGGASAVEVGCMGLVFFIAFAFLFWCNDMLFG